MGSLTNLYVSQSYQGLIKLADSTTGSTGTLQYVQDGLGNDLALQISTTTVNVTGSLLVNGVPVSSGSSGTSGTSGLSGSSGTSGTSGLSGSSGTSGVNGSSGTSGTSGVAGSSGTSGTSGQNGSSGTSGTSGVNGSSGTSGSSGISGSSGTSGSSGLSGSSGTSGLNGSSGTSGTSGLNGSSGTSGTSGIDGSSGTSGISGSSGTSGTSGISGSSGSSGISGSSGTSGTSGIDGSSGTSGTSGIDGSSGTSGTSGIAGSSGTSGTSGLDGSSGTSGVSGSSGTSGVSGSSGTSGTSGIDGSSGTSGTSGTDGSSGTSGVSGTDGSSGTSGSSGVNGSSGTSGTSGIDGSSGTSGVSGSSGSSGISGTDGSSGTSGTSGIDGSSGTSGTSGIDGSSGTSGTSGIDGSSGTSGTSGVNGADGIFTQTGSFYATTNALQVTGSLIVSGSGQYDLQVPGQILVANTSTAATAAPRIVVSGATQSTTINRANTIISSNAVTNSINQNGMFLTTGLGYQTQYLGKYNFYPESGSASTYGIGLTANPTDIEVGVVGWGGPTMYQYNPNTGEYESFMGLQSVTGWTDGTVSFLYPTDFYKDVSVSGSLVNTGSIYVTNVPSGSTSDEFIVYNTGSGLFERRTGGGGGSIDTSSLATTGSNTFVGDQTIDTTFKLITENVSANGSALTLDAVNLNVLDNVTPGGLEVRMGANEVFYLDELNSRLTIKEDLRVRSDNSGFRAVLNTNTGDYRVYNFFGGEAGGPDVQFGVESAFTVINLKSNDAGIYINDGTTDFLSVLTGTSTIDVAYPINSVNGFTGSLEGTSSFAVTASFALNGGGGGSVDTSSLATTGSNTFVGNQVITGSLRGQVLTITPVLSGSIYTSSFDLSLSNNFELQFQGSSINEFYFSNIKPGQSTNVLIHTSGSSLLKLPELSTYTIGGSQILPSTGSTVDLMTIYSVNTGSIYVDYTKNFVPIPSSALDPDAELYITALTGAGYTPDSTVETAIDTLFKDLKDAGLYSKMQAVYPFLGGTASTCKFNAVNPVDSNAAYRLTFSGGITFSSVSGATGNSSGYADTYLASTVDLLDFDKHLSVYNMIDTNTLGGWDGVWDLNGAGVWGINIGTSNAIGYGLNSGPSGAGGTPTNWDGLYTMVLSSSSAGTAKTYKDSSVIFTLPGAPGTFTSTQNYLLFGLNFNGAGNGHSRTYGFYTLGKALTAGQVGDLNTIITAFLTSIGRI